MRVGRVREITGGRGADLAVEVVGMAELLPEGLAMITNGGTYLDIGLFFSGRTVDFDPSSFVLSGKKLMGTAMYEPLVLPQVLDFLARNQDRVPLHKLVSHRFPLDAVNDALNQSEWVTGPHAGDPRRHRAVAARARDASCAPARRFRRRWRRSGGDAPRRGRRRTSGP